MGDAAPLRWSRVALVLLLGLVALELACRLAIAALVGRPFESFDAYTFSGYGVYRQNPRYTHREFVHNSAGFRNLREFSVEKPPGTLRIMGIGASVLYSGSAISHRGFSRRIPTDETITAYLERDLADSPALAGADLEVINTAVNRQDVRQTLAYYTAELARYDPDVVLVFGTHNDSSYLELEDGRDQMFYRPDQPTDEEARVELLLNESSGRALAEKAVRVAANRSALAATAFRVVDRVLSRAGRAAQGGRRSAAAELELASAEEMERALDTYLAFLGSLVGFIQQTGARPVVFWEYLLLELEGIKPFTDYERDLAEFLRGWQSLSPERLAARRRVRERVAAYLEARGVPLVDIAGPVRDYRGNLFNDYLHYDSEGNRWVASVLAERLAPILAERTAGGD